MPTRIIPPRQITWHIFSFPQTISSKMAMTVTSDPLVTTTEVVSDGPGWVMIHAQANGKPGPILSYSPVADGENSNVVVEIDAFLAAGMAYAMLHTDAGEIGTWKFPDGPDTPVVWEFLGGPDTPVTVGEQVVPPAFRVTAGLPVTLPETGKTVASWMLILVAAGGLIALGGFALRWQA